MGPRISGFGAIHQGNGEGDKEGSAHLRPDRNFTLFIQWLNPAITVEGATIGGAIP
jgi:hypothetical protein